ncbi:MAG TPA: ABC transporter substrate-binding protein [Thermoanaerobaculia bacterium]|nr:ABC transporter substrate-binding protein [Thermoanaerobaculia bacterium]
MIGEKLADRYLIESELGRGGMGVVYRARDPMLNRDVAIKVIASSVLTPETERRFQTEAQVVAQLDHPSIVPIFDFGRHDGSLFFVMPIVEGQSLRELLRARSLTLGQVMDVGAGCAEALDYSHARGVIHRDIKPENVMVSFHGDATRVRLMDFGLARGTNISSLTKTGMLMGTMSYISPEQVSGATVDGRADLYSLGCVLYECVVHDVPFTGEVQSLLYRISHEVPQSPRSLGCPIDQELEDLVLACLEKDPRQRPQTGGELATRLRAYRAKLRDSQRMQTMAMTRTMAAPRPALSPFVGRRDEFSQLQKALNAALRGECQIALIGGDPGVGKSRLLDELATLAEVRQIRVLRGRFVEQHGAFPYHGFCEAIQEFFRQKELGSSGGATLDLSDLAADLVALFPMLSEIEAIRSAITGDSVITETTGSRAAENRTEIFELLARTLIRLADGHPLVLLLEDLHGADASIEALQYIVRRLGPTPTMIAGTYRSTEVDRAHPVSQMIESFQGDRRFGAIHLGPLGPEDHQEFVVTLTGGSSVDEDLALKLFEATEGNPFFTKELIRSLLDSGSIAQDETGAWSLAGAEISSEALPATIQQAVETRIGRLPDELRGILSVAAVLGRSFDFDDLEALVGEQVDDHVDRLIQEGLLEEDRQSRGDRLSFSSAVVREVLYSELPRRRRRSLHRKYAQRLEKRQANRLERVYPQLLYHFYEGDDPEKTVEYGLLHARKSLESWSPEEVVRACKTALEFLDEDWAGDPTSEGEARLLLAEGHRLGGDLQGALRELAAAVEVFERTAEPARRLSALLQVAKTAWQARQSEEARSWVDRGLHLARVEDDREHLLEFLSLAATLANLRGEYARGSAYLEEASRLRQSEDRVSAADEIPRGGRLIAALANQVSAQVPVDMHLTEEFEVLSNVFEPLLRTDEEGNLRPLLCERWEGLDGGRTFRFAVSPAARFHDGTRIDAGEVKASIERAIRETKSDLPPAFAAIRGAAELAAGAAEEAAGITVTSDVGLEIALLEPLPIYPTLLTDPRTGISKPATAAGGLHLGSGPFLLAAHAPDRVVLERHEAYWGGAPPALDAVEFRAGLPSAQIATEFERGELDLARDLLPADLEELLRDRHRRSQLVERPQKFTYFVLFNARTGPLAGDERVRHALAGVVRARDLVWRALGRFAAPAVGIVPPGILGHDPGRRRHPLGRDEARALLAESGAGVPGETVKLRAAVHPLIRDRFGSLLEGLLEVWAELGFEVEIATAEMDSYLESWQQNEGIDLMVTRWMPDIDDPDACTHALFHSAKGQFRAYFCSPETDEILEQARQESRPQARELLYRRFESWLLDRHVLVPLFNDIGYRLAGPRVRGLSLRSIQPQVNYSELGKSESVTSIAAEPLLGGGVLRIPMSGRVTSLDPMTTNLVEEVESLSPVFEPLVRDVGEARIEPWLAEDLQVENGGRSYRFRLRPDVVFHDGRRLSARDVRFSFERLLLNEQAEARVLFSVIKGARELIAGRSGDLAGFVIHSATEFTIELERPLAFFPVLLASPSACVVPEGTGTIAGRAADAVGTGPFRVVAFEPGRRLELARHPSYWKSGLPRCESLSFQFGVSPEEILRGFRDGLFTLAADLFPADVEALRREPAFAAGYRETPRLCTYYFAFNTRSGPLADLETRRRFADAVDAERLVRQTLGRLALPARGLIPPGLLGHDPTRATSRPIRPQSKRDTGEELTLRALVNPVFATEYRGFAEELTKALADAGIVLQATLGVPTAASVKDASGEHYDLYLGRWIADYPDADTFAWVMHTVGGNLGRYCGGPELDRLIEEGRTESDPAARHALYRRLEEILERELRMLPLFHEHIYRFTRPEVEGLDLSYGAPNVAYETLHFKGA